MFCLRQKEEERNFFLTTNVSLLECGFLGSMFKCITRTLCKETGRIAIRYPPGRCVMRSIQVVLFLGATLLILTALAGCGYNGSTAGSSQPVSPTRSSPSPTGAGAVTVQVEKSFYLATETITVTIYNRSSSTILFPDHLTNCTVILLHRQKAQPEASDQGITDINPCKMMIVTRMHSLAAGQQLVVHLVSPKGGWLTGWFLATLSYHSVSASASPTTISSPAFAIGPLGM